MDHKTDQGGRRSRDARVLRSRAALRGALVALLADSDVADVTVQAIVIRAGVGYATFFRHYPSVEALLIDVADVMIAEFIGGAMPVIAAGDRAAMLTALAGYVTGRRRAVRALLVGGGETVRRELLSRAISQASALPSAFDPAIPSEVAVAHAVGTTISILAWWAAASDERGAEHVIGLIERLALMPLSA